MRASLGLLLLICGVINAGWAQQSSSIAPLTIEKVMQDPKWIGTSPSAVEWSADGRWIYFNWNPDNAPADSLYALNVSSRAPQKLRSHDINQVVYARQITYNRRGDAFVFSRAGDIFMVQNNDRKEVRITATDEIETNPVFAAGDRYVVYERSQNLFAWDIGTGETRQLTHFVEGKDPAKAAGEHENAQEQWLKKDQLEWMEVLRQRKENRDKTAAVEIAQKLQPAAKTIYIGDLSIGDIQVNATAGFIAYKLSPRQERKNTAVPAYVTETGFTALLQTRPKVGVPAQPADWFVYDRVRDTVIKVLVDSLPGIKELPNYLNDYPERLKELRIKPPVRIVTISNFSWAPSGKFAMLDIRAQDNKDRWLVKFNPENGALVTMDRQHDDAWVGGVATGRNAVGWIDDNRFWYRSEVSGFAHLYVVNITNGEKKALTSGHYEVQQTLLSRDKKSFYITTNQVHPGEQQFYRLPVGGGAPERITSLTGANQVFLSPDEKKVAFLYSYGNRPWELYLQDNKAGSAPQQLTFKAQSDSFNLYSWRDPELITFKARDGADVYARLYRPAQPHPSKPAVIFVHGAGYLQNAHKWWSSYFREYMFHNMLADNAYYVLDIDYRGSAGYGRDWRTGIYRHMGGKDLEDHVDGAKWLTAQFGVDPQHIGIYGGSYGGFITLMGMFTTPGVFAAGAALRPVTDWAHYNHEYTSNILNTPVQDSIAYRRSSPIYFANGLKDPLLICHGMVDVNVHVQDVIRLNQRLIELGKNNWEVALYPMEDHGFIEPSSWTDEYKRIYKLFESVLKK